MYASNRLWGAPHLAAAATSAVPPVLLGGHPRYVDYTRVQAVADKRSPATTPSGISLAAARPEIALQSVVERFLYPHNTETINPRLFVCGGGREVPTYSLAPSFSEYQLARDEDKARLTYMHNEIVKMKLEEWQAARGSSLV
jgi:hypothetical protein